jgi:fructose-bisphosphate aldolase, class II
MPIASREVYEQMLDNAKAGGFAYPAVNCTSSQTIIATMRGFAEAECDGIVQFSTGGAAFAAGVRSKNMVAGAVALAEFAHSIADQYPINVALHTDHCPEGELDHYMRPLLELGAERVRNGLKPLFNSHMWDGSAIDLARNIDIADELLDKSNAANTIMEIEIGAVGGEEDGVEASADAHLFSTVEDVDAMISKLGLTERGRYLVAATFGNVHGVYKPGNVVLTPSILRELQDKAIEMKGLEPGSKPLDLVFHGGSGSLLSEIHEALDNGVVKMNIDTDTQYAFTRPIVDHLFSNYSGALKVDGDVGNKKIYDPRSYGKLAEESMAARVAKAAEDLRATGTQLR